VYHLSPRSFTDNLIFLAAIVIGGIAAAVVGFLIGFRRCGSRATTWPS